MTSWLLLGGKCTPHNLPPRVRQRLLLCLQRAQCRAATSTSSSNSSDCYSYGRLFDPSSWIVNPELKPYVSSTLDNVSPMKPTKGLPFGIHFLGTGAGTPSLQRGSSSTALTMGGCTYLFDAGEGVQQRLMQNPRVRFGDIKKMFITHLHGDHIFGLPGLLLSLQQVAKLRVTHKKTRQPQGTGWERRSLDSLEDSIRLGLSIRSQPPRVLEIYGPVGLYNFIASSISLSCTELKYVHVDVFELTGGSRRWVHPGSLGDYREFQHRGLRRHVIPQNKDGTWTLETPIEIRTPEDADRYSSSPAGVCVQAAQIMHTPKLQCFGYVVQEPFTQPRTIDVERGKTLGVIPGKAYKLLKSGFAVPSDDGSRMIRPEEVWRKDDVPNKARKLAILGDCGAVPRPMIELCQNADVLVHEATFLESQEGLGVDRGGHSTAAMAASVANQVKARVLALNHVSATHQNAFNEGRLVKEAERVLENGKHTKVQLAYDLLDFDVPRKGFPEEWG